jgi:arylsulfatase A-like enzyme
MRVLYIDVDSLRPDHLGCYGYHRATSPNIDLLAAEGAIVRGLYASDTPCLPSRTAFFGGRFGTATGVVNHGGRCADLQPQGADRDFRSGAAVNSLGSLLTQCGYWTASISPFPRRHSGYQITYGFNETVDTGGGGLENADVIFAEVERWLSYRAKHDNWFLHVNMWDPHTPNDTPASFGNPFADQPIDPWITEDIIERQRQSYGPHSAREVPGHDSRMDPSFWPWGRGEIRSLEDAKVHIDGYDCGVAYADAYIGRIFDLLKDAGVWEETAVIVSADHGENLGELNVWGDHQTADQFTNHIPAVIRWPGVTKPGTGLDGLHYNLDLAATMVELASPKGTELVRKAGWQGSSMADRFESKGGGRDRLYLSQGAWSLQRSVRWEDWILIHTIHTGCKDFSEWMLFDLAADPHQTRNLATERPEIVRFMGRELTEWFAQQARLCSYGDPFEVVKSENGPYHAKTRGAEWETYLARLGATGRRAHADWLLDHGGAPRPADLATY